MFLLRKSNSSVIQAAICQAKFLPVTDQLIKCPFHQIRHSSQDVVSQHSQLNGTGNENFIQRMFGKLGLFNKAKYQALEVAYLSYENVVDGLDYSTFYKDFNMADTLFSWFLITELHVWMLMVRYMAEGKSGRFLRNNLVEAMWKDVETRMSKLGAMSPSVKRKQLQELSAQFNAAIIGYDEGLLADDQVLAGALWRRFFKLEGNNPEQLEKLVIYVRRQINLLDNMPTQEILTNPKLKLIELKSIA